MGQEKCISPRSQVLKEAWKSHQLKQNDDRIKEKSKQQSYRISDLQWVKLIISESWVTSMEKKKTT